MTIQRRDSHSTEFGIWLRNQDEISSKNGFVTTNIDYLWENYNTLDWMIIEEKRFIVDLSYSQKKTYGRLKSRLDSLCDPHFKGIHLLQFEHTNPNDGAIYLNGQEITKEKLISFLQFKGE